MNKDKIIKDLKEKNRKLKNQYELQEVRLCSSQHKVDELKEQIENQAEIIRKQSEKIIPENIDLHNRINKAIEYIEQLLKEEFEITDEDNIDYGRKCQRAYFSDSEIAKVIEILRGDE